MTPKQYLNIKMKLVKIINEADHVIDEAKKEAEKYPLPKKLRPARSIDIVEDAILWYPSIPGREEAYWNIVVDVQNPKSDFKAYCAEDGCRYGLDGAFIEEE